ncbi:hypothetical protein HELRODRAFT_159187 [Helobdella robusta]|uniref:Putative rRNA methyltransferase n=1 Tax=Helobdella robusta TaxID=6412 RepID=T1ENQ2_HELRO|nr:hypothetical protein HELRODRAFT_159187 [Helobdella robusta]ESO12619.1 hypothetical protein HELRODRAFT_159187 [Helobdella robusta]
MGKVKVGKARRDKFYQLAKETGYRSRASFKLLQLNRKFEFLQKSSICIDLCAAPGGWLQVAQQYMPVSSLIIECVLIEFFLLSGVDLVAIKPINGVITLKEDITTDKCRQSLRKLLPDQKADLVLHDGAPNVGKNWVHDAYQQAELTLKALHLATFFLVKGGYFITKVFRSKDYFSLLWVLQQMFKKVHATKPLASRNESAEIFVVCQGYLAPDVIDPKFLDSKHVFKDVEQENSVRPTLNLVHPDKISKKAEGYDENNYLQMHKLSAVKFITDANFLELFKHCTEIVLDDESIISHPSTTDEIKECCKDIQVLGKKDLKNLLSWRKCLNKSLPQLNIMANDNEKMDVENDQEETIEGVEMENDEANKDADSDNDSIEEVIEQEEKELSERRARLLKDKKKKHKKVMNEKRKLREKMALQMVIPGDSIQATDDIDLFSFNSVKKDAGIAFKCDDVEPDDDDDDDDEDDAPEPARRIKFDKEDVALYDDEGEAWNKLNRHDSDDDEEEDKVEGDHKASSNNKKRKIVKLNPLELAIGEEIVKSKKRRRELVELSYNRYAYGEDSAPDWFLHDEMKHSKKQLPVTKEQIQYYKEKQKAIDANPIKKIAEARARQKHKLVKRLEKARKRTENIGEDLPEKEKMKQAKEIYKKAGLLKAQKKKDVTYVVAKRGVGKRVSRPAGVKGHFKVVDPRMKKDNRKMKHESKSKGRKSSAGKQKSNKKAGKGRKKR